jgi:sec-independent protein translocase protein TatA
MIRPPSWRADLYMPNIGPMELVIVLVIALLVLGPKRLPDAGKAVGKGMREFKESLSGSSKDDEVDTSHITSATHAD